MSTWLDQRKLSLMVLRHCLAGRWFLVAAKSRIGSDFPQVSGRFESTGHVTRPRNFGLANTLTSRKITHPAQRVTPAVTTIQCLQATRFPATYSQRRVPDDQALVQMSPLPGVVTAG